MPRVPRGAGDASGSRWVVGLLLASLGLAGLLAWQGHYAVRTHRRMAESVLQDYAATAADELARRAGGQIGFSGVYPLIMALREEAAGTPPERPLPMPDALLPDTPEAAALARSSLRWQPGAARLVTSGVPLDPAAERWLLGRLAMPLSPSAGGYVSLHWTTAAGGSRRRSFVVAPVAAGNAEIVGFELEPAALAPWLERAFASGPLLPPSLGDARELGSDVVHVQVVDPAGREVFRAGRPFTSYYGVERPFGGERGGLFEDFVVRAAVDPGAARSLVIGGLPRSRLPILAALFALSAGLVLIALRQLRRERALARLRSDFVSQVSHELRTPLTQIRLFAETLLLDRARTDEERRRALAVIDREARRLAQLVDNVLQFSRGERGTLRLAPRAQEIGPLLAEVAEEFRPLAAGARARLDLRLEEGIVAAVDEGALRQIVLNLLDNAVKYGPPGQEVRLGLERIGEAVRIVVEDEGPGVPPSERERIWERFYRLERDRRSVVAGAGIGLAVVRELVVLHGGRTRVEDRGAGDLGAPGDRGARFVVELPALPEAAEEAEEDR